MMEHEILDVVSLRREGNDMIVTLRDGRVTRLVNAQLIDHRFVGVDEEVVTVETVTLPPNFKVGS